MLFSPCRGPVPRHTVSCMGFKYMHHVSCFFLSLQRPSQALDQVMEQADSRERDGSVVSIPPGPSADAAASTAPFRGSQVQSPVWRSLWPVHKYKGTTLLAGKRFWTLDFFSQSFKYWGKGKDVKRTHAAADLLQLECHTLDRARLRMLFLDRDKSYDLQFASAAQCQRFYQCASALRPSVRMWSPHLVPTTAPDHVWRIPGVAVNVRPFSQDGKGFLSALARTTSDAQNSMQPVKGSVCLDVSRVAEEPLKIWTGTWNQNGRRPNEAALGHWLTPGADIYAVGAQEGSWQHSDTEWFGMVAAQLGSDYITLATMQVS